MPISDPTQVWLILAVVAATVAATVATARLWPSPRPVLPPQHVAGAALVGVIGWESLINLPSIYLVFYLRYAGISDAPAQLADQILVGVATAYVIASAVAIFGVLRRRSWGVVLAVAICLGRVAAVVTGMVSWLELVGTFDGSDPNLALTLLTFALGAVPAIVAIGLFVWPLTRTRGHGTGFEHPASDPAPAS